MQTPRGFVLWETRKRIAIATGITGKGSRNSKTGDMVQVWILCRDVEPHVAVQTGDDALVCGDCPFRGTACYVLTHFAPLSIFRGYHRGIYPTLNLNTHWHLLQDRFIRLGAYGDPACVPVRHWERITKYASGWSGYTHQWRTCDPELRHYCMASVDTPQEAREARRAGWRYFRTRLPKEGLMANEVMCPASEEAGKRLTCEECLACHGGDSKTSITIVRHGARNRINQYDQWRAANV